jgi:hypothetical protein
VEMIRKYLIEDDKFLTRSQGGVGKKIKDTGSVFFLRAPEWGLTNTPWEHIPIYGKCVLIRICLR